MKFEVEQVSETQFDVVFVNSDGENDVQGSYPKASSAIARVEELTAQYNRLMEIL